MNSSRIRRLLSVTLVISVGSAVVAGAQGGPPRTNDRPIASRRYEADRDALEKRFEQRIDAILRQRLRLSDEQQEKLREVASRTEESRRVLRREEFALRTSLRTEMQAGEKANEEKVSDLLEQMPRLERRKLELMESEQRDLAKFLSPTQRARYFGLQDELRRGMQELQRRRMTSADSTAGAMEGRGARRRGPPPLR